MLENKALLSVTDIAAEKIKDLINKRKGSAVGIKVGVKPGGCSGLSYYIEYADKIEKGDEVVECKGVKLIIPPMAVMYLAGTTMDYSSTEVKSGFIFKNPNEKDKCGCGESFRV